MKIGILGGTFDPIHNAHLNMAKYSKEQYSLDEVWFMPSPNPPHKSKSNIADIKHRIAMINLAIEGVEGFKLSDFEANKSEVCYTADTLTELKGIYPDNTFYFIIGHDSLLTFDHWYNTDVILQKANILVVPRTNSENCDTEKTVDDYNKRFGNHFSFVDMPKIDISSTNIRKGQDLEHSVPKKVNDYIKDHNLYQDIINEQWSVEDIENDLKSTLKPSRFEHSINVAKTAVNMANAFGINPNQAYLAGILHDCAKNLSNEELLDICQKHDEPLSDIELSKPQYLLHQIAGVHVAKEKYHVYDNEILDAIRYHTTGKADMTLLEKIIFSADYIEPGRFRQPRLDYLREISTKDIDLLIRCILEDMLEYFKANNEEVEQKTLDAYNYYVKKGL